MIAPVHHVPVHDIPGRLRFRLDPLRRDRRKAAELRARMRAIAGVRSVAAHPLTGSLIVHHDDAADTRQNILAALAECTPSTPPARRLAEAENKLAGILANALAGRLVEQVLRAAVGVVI